MKKIISLLTMLILFSNFSYASFPVTVIEKTEVIEYDSINNLPVIFIGVLLGILSSFIFPLNLLLLIFIKDRSFRKSFMIGMTIGIIILAIWMSWVIYQIYLISPFYCC